MVPKTGLEPVRLSRPADFKSAVSANSTTSAKIPRLLLLFLTQKINLKIAEEAFLYLTYILYHIFLKMSIGIIIPIHISTKDLKTFYTCLSILFFMKRLFNSAIYNWKQIIKFLRKDLFFFCLSKNFLMSFR